MLDIPFDFAAEPSIAVPVSRAEWTRAAPGPAPSGLRVVEAILLPRRPSMAKLNDVQLLLLTTAASRADGGLLPPPEQLADLGARVRRSITALVKQGLVREVAGGEGDAVWREEDGRRFSVVITDAGREAVGMPAPVVAEPAALGGKKIDRVLELLMRGEGATLPELTAATGWLPHTTRAAMTGLRKKGHDVTRDKRGEATCYRIVVEA
jgi:hypothetical protein